MLEFKENNELNIKLLCVGAHERLRVRLHVTETKSHPGIKKFMFTREFHPGMKQVEFHSGIKFNLKGNLPLSMKTYNKIYH